MICAIIFVEVDAMKLTISKSKNSKSFYISKSFINKEGKSTTKTIKKLGTLDSLSKMLNTDEAGVIAWCREEVRKATEDELKDNEKVLVSLSPSQYIEKNKSNSYNCGYLFLQSLYYGLRIDNICRNIGNHHKYEYDLNAILSDLIYARIIDPCSKRASFETAKSFLEPPKYQLHDIYRALSVIANESDYIQAELYKNSNFVVERNSKVLYYDCTNFYFEIEQEEDSRMYGKSKENRPNPIIQMGLFMDGNGIPLSFNLFPGNQNEQPSLRKAEKALIEDFSLSKFVVCTDGGLGSEDNRFFNHFADRAFIVTQSVKKLKKEEMEWVLKDEGWKDLSTRKPIKLSDIDLNNPEILNHLYYKEEPYETKKVNNQRLIVTFSPKYAVYQKHIRDKQVERAKQFIEKGKKTKGTSNPNDPKRFIDSISVTENGEVAVKTMNILDTSKIENEAKFDGFYGIATDLLDDDVASIIKISEGRWEIEESFRIMKSEFDARPVFLSRDDRIKAHFLICYMALLLYRILEKKLDSKFTAPTIIKTLKEMNLTAIEAAGYVPSYTRTDCTDALHEIMGFRTDKQIIKKSVMRTIIKNTKQK